MKMKKIAAALMGLSIAASFTACAGASTSSSESSSETSKAETTQGSSAAASGDTLTVAIWDTNQEPGLTKIINEFTQKTGIKAQIQVTPWDQYWTMLEAGASGGSLPDVFWMHSNEINKYAKYEMLLDLTDRIKSSDKVEMDKFPQDIVNIYNYDGKQFAVPKDIDTIALWYNKKMFDEAGLKYPDESWTWDDFKNACAKLTKSDGSQYGYALKPSNNQDGWYNMVYSMGGEIISEDKKSSGFDKEGTIKAIDFMTGIIKAGYTPSYEVVNENDPTVLFESGKVAMITQGSWMLAELCNNDYVKANADIAPLPKDASTGRRVSIYNGLGWAAAANTKNPDAAWQLIEYLGSKEAQQKQSDLGIVISAYEGTTDNWIKAYPGFNLQAYLDMMKDLQIRPYSKSTVVWENMISEKLIKAWTGEQDAKTVCADIAKEMNALLAEEE